MKVKLNFAKLPASTQLIHFLMEAGMKKRITILTWLVLLSVCPVSISRLLAWPNFIAFADATLLDPPSRAELKEYARLKDQQKDLINRWTAELNQKSSKNRHPATVYAALSLSRRTTFEAITHSLVNTKLTDEGGRSLGRAVDLVDTLENIAGEIQGLKGDKEYRLYVALKPNALATLSRAREFARGHDNTIFHKNYPLNYRLRGGAPSLQFSVTEDGTRADIDVDYRSSKFPRALWDGHLTAGNSDVRAGANYLVHLSRWFGLLRWWPFGKAAKKQADEASGADEGIGKPHAVAQPEFTSKQIEEAKGVSETMENFLETWLIKQSIKDAMKFVSQRHLICAGNSHHEMQGSYSAPLSSLQQTLSDGIKTLGQTKELQGALEDLRNWDPGPYFIPHTNQRLFLVRPFTLSDPGDKACLDSLMAQQKDADAFATYLIFNVKGHPGSGLRLTWAKEGGDWRVINTRLITH